MHLFSTTFLSKLHLEAAIRKGEVFIAFISECSKSELLLDCLAWSSNVDDNNKVLLPIYWAHSAQNPMENTYV